LSIPAVSRPGRAGRVGRLVAASRRAALAVAWLAAASACGTGSKETSTEAKPSPGRGAAAGAASTGAATAGSASAASAASAALAAGSAAAAAAPAAKPREPSRVAYSLMNNRLAAHLERGGGLVVPAGSMGFAKYLRFGNQLAGERSPWLLRQREGDAFVARMARAKAAVYVPLTAAQAARGTVRVRAHGAGTLWLSANGNLPVEGTLSEGWSTVDFALPAGQLVEGENTLELVASAPRVGVAWLHVGAAAPLDASADLSLRDPMRRALSLPRGGRMSWYVLIPDRARLSARVSAGCTVRVRAVAAAGPVVEGVLAGAAAVELTSLAGQAVRLELESAGCARATEPALLSNAALEVPGEPPRISRGDPPTHVVFVILDSLRFDRVHAFEPAVSVETPTLDRLAETSTLFLGHYVQGNESQVSHASMWTSMYLAKHKAARWEDPIPSRGFTLDKVAKRAGKYTVAVTGNGYIRKSRGYGTWDHFQNHIEDELGLRGETIIDRGFSFIAPHKASPWFLYLGLIDTHVPWLAKPPWIERYSPGYKGRYAKAFLGDEEPSGLPKDLSDREKQHVRAIYDSNVSYQDELLGKLIARLEAWGVWDQTLLVVTADHGDELWEDGRVGHEKGQDDTLLHVPLLIHYPPLFPPGRITHATEGIDLLPTIADALGIEPDDEWQGTSLIPAAHGAFPYAGLASSSGYEKEHGARVGPWKLRLAGTASPSLFLLSADPDELHDLFGTPAGAIGGRLVLDAMSLLRAHHASWKKARWGDPANVTPRFPADFGE
jgi:arylsulfatase A-like enzyme